MKKEAHDSPYNQKMIKLAEQLVNLKVVELKRDLAKFKEGAHSIADRSKNPKLKEICKKLDELEIR